jgi:serine/threonine-protein kinase RsbW
VELIDEGKTFNPQAVATPDFESLPESGMGLYIIRAFVDEMDYSPGPPNVLTLTKRFSSSGQQS